MSEHEAYIGSSKCTNSTIIDLNSLSRETTFSNEVTSDEPYITLRNLRSNNNNRLIICHLNINSIRNKFEPLKSLIKDNCDVILISESKLDSSFPSHQFDIDGFCTPFRMDRNSRGGGVLLYVRDDIPCKLLKKHTLPSNVECLFIELNLRKYRWVLAGGYNPTKDNISYFLKHVGKSLDNYLGNYDNLLLLGDFNSVITEEAMCDFSELNGLHSLISDPTCFKNVNNPTSIDLILTNRFKNFCNSTTIETGLSDFHKMTVTVLKTFFRKKEPVTIKYRCYKRFVDTLFKCDLTQKLANFDKKVMNYNDFHGIFMEVLNIHAPMKSKTIRGNNAPFMNKILSKAFMLRSRLKNCYNKKPTETNNILYKKQRNYCVNLLKREKRNYYCKLSLNIFKDNKTFWKSIKPLFSDKCKSVGKEFTLIVDNVIISEQSVIAESLNNFFIESVENLDIIPFSHTSSDSLKSVSEIIKEYEFHPSIMKIKEIFNVREVFTFHETSSQEIKQKIDNLDS